MSRWKIYSKDGSVLHESIEKYDGKGRVVEQDTLEYSGKWMGDCFITVSFKSAYPIDFQIGDYIIYRGEKFTINYDPTVVKKSSRGTYGEGFVYDSVKFNALSNELTDVKFHDWVLSDNHVHYSSLPNFSFYAKDMNDLADRLQACMDRWCKDNGFAKEDYWIFYTPGSAGDSNPYDRTITRAKDISTDETFLANILARWKSIYGDGGTLVERADELIDKNVQINNQTVWQGMALFKSDFGLNFIIRGREVIVGAAGTIASHIFKYGKGNGLYEVDRQADNDQKVVTRLHAYGSSDNLPTRYYAELDMKVFANVTSVDKGKDFFRLALDMDYKPSMFTQKMSKYGDDIFAIKVMLGETEIKARIEGHDDNNKAKIYSEYLANSTDPDDNTDKSVYDIFYNAVDTGKKIYITGGINKDLAPSGHIDYAANHLPDNMAINNLMLPGFPKYALSDLCKSEYDESSDTTNYYIRKDKDSTDYVKFHSESGNHVVRFSSEQYDPYIVSANADKLGYKDDDIFCTEENDDNGLKKVYPSVEEITEAEAGVSTDDKTYINTIVSADIIKDNGVYPKKTGTSVPGFQVVIKNLGFDLQDAIAAAGGESCKLSMKDGHCGGRDFDVPSVSKNSDGTWTLNCKRSPDSSLDLYYPYSYNMSIGGTASADEAYQIHKGDHFVLTGIAMEATNYVWAASVKLLRKAIHWLCKNDYSRYTYSPKIDEIYMARQDQEAQKSEGKVKSLHDTIKEGDLLWFQDDDLLLDGKVYIDQLVIKENGNNGIPTYDVTLRNEVQVGTIQRIQNKVDSIANDVKSGNVGDSMSASNVENIVNAVGDGKYLRKDQDDETTHKLTMGEANVKNDFTVGEFIKSLYEGKGAGIDKNGNAEVESLRVRSSMDVMELIVNQLSAIEGDQLLTESDTIESVTKDNDGTYTLKLKSKWDGYFTAQAENSVLKGIINTLAQGSGEYHTAWFRVNSVNTANNSINVTMYPDDETPAGKNYEPQALMKIARWGNATDPTRQSCIYLSSTEGRIVKLVNVTKPIIDKTNYGTTWGSLPDFVKSLKDDDGNLLPLRDGLDYLYAPGIVTMDIVRLNKWTNKRLPTYVDRGAFAQGSKYYCEATNPDTGEYETSDVWYYGCKWRSCKNLTSTAPAWNNTDWAMMEGNPEFSVDFAEAEFIVDPDNVNIPLTLVAKLYNMDVTDDIRTEDIAWTRYSEDADGNERTALDNQWTLKHAGTGKSITLTKDDMDMGAYMPKTIRFTCTATLRDGENNAVATEAVSYEY